jgi:hypothetical protein
MKNYLSVIIPTKKYLSIPPKNNFRVLSFYLSEFPTEILCDFVPCFYQYACPTGNIQVITIKKKIGSYIPLFKYFSKLSLI